MLKEEDGVLSMPSEVNSVVRQKQRATENGFWCYVTGRLKINRAIYSLQSAGEYSLQEEPNATVEIQLKNRYK